MSLRLFTVLLVAAFIGLSGCSSQSTPENTVADFYGYIAAGKFDKAVNLFYLGEKEFSKEEAEMVNNKVGAMLEAMKQQIDEHKGLKTMQVDNAEVSEDGTRANVSVTLKFKDDTERREQLELIKVKNDWKINLR